MEIRTYSQLQKVMEQQIQIAIEEVAQKIKLEIQDYIQKNVYDKPESSTYRRTKEYLNSLSVKKVAQSGGLFTAEIYFDTDKIKPYAPSNGEWSKHSSITSYNGGGSGDDVSYMIPIWMEYGTSGGIVDRDGIYAMENTKKILEQTKYHLHEIKRVLNGMGVKVTFG